jgi:cysteine desulfurase
VIYLDHNASSPLDPRLAEAYRRGLDEGWANPSSQHTEGRKAKALLEAAREQVASLFGVSVGQVTFTSSGTEALNQALFSVTRPGERVDVLASAVEHPGVLNALADLSERGLLKHLSVPVDATAQVNLSALEKLLMVVPSPALLVVLAAQNEVGTVQPLDAVRKLCPDTVPLLVDATQALGRLERDWARSPWDYLVVSSHKLGGPRGAAALIHRGRAPEPRPLLLGGSQERGRRAGTEDTAAIVALGAACALVEKGELCDPRALRTRRDAFEDDLRAAVPGLRILGQGVERLPQTTLALVPEGDGEALLAGLDLAGICASTGSACSSGARVPSHVLAAMGEAPAARGRLRFSFGPHTTAEELSQAATVLGGLVQQG